MHLSVRQIHFKAFHNTIVIVRCIWVFRLVKDCNLVATKCQYFTPSTVGTDFYLLHVSKLYGCKEYTEGYLWNEAQFYIYDQKNILRKPNSRISQARGIKGIRMKPSNIFEKLMLEPILYVWSPTYNTENSTIDVPTVVWKQILKEKAGKPGFWLRIESLPSNLSKQVMPTPFNIDIAFKWSFEWLL